MEEGGIRWVNILLFSSRITANELGKRINISETIWVYNHFIVINDHKTTNIYVGFKVIYDYKTTKVNLFYVGFMIIDDYKMSWFNQVKMTPLLQ